MATSDVFSQTQWQTLFHQLVHSIENEELIDIGTASGEVHAKEIVFEVCSDGFVYALTRTPTTSNHERISLSPREKEIIRLVCEGLPNKSISDVLEISPWTVATYLKRIFAKLAVCSRAEMVARVLQDRLLDPPNHQLQ